MKNCVATLVDGFDDIVVQKIFPSVGYITPNQYTPVMRTVITERVVKMEVVGKGVM